jgi:DNA mismatch repair protein MSH6
LGHLPAAASDSDGEFNDDASGEGEEYEEGSEASVEGSDSEGDGSDGFAVDSDEEDDGAPAKKAVATKKRGAAAAKPSAPKAPRASGVARQSSSQSSSQRAGAAGGSSSSAAAKAKAMAAKAAANASAAAAAADGEAEGSEVTGAGFLHTRLAWYHDPVQVRDASGKAAGDAGFNKRTLHVSEAFMCDCSPAQTQWWDTKRRNLDLVLMVKIGKFYEMYHGDADVGVKHCHLAYMKGDVAHCGFPELSYGRYAEVLAAKGYR